ncbi:MAG: bifunctional phosphoribosyl-AMP cyclohydrolase/phosphoribosyl-ATP diphosphatase HisIE [Candidatus Margulisbacteria bacterium]|nr:bifunctional phosphoribosyl-AMP cyclohydrolase/phosphoribosyl-ATP diphosphatase HisIE [Candidatus Margulisiibacteriota bacterium]
MTDIPTLKFDKNGLLPVVAQSYLTGKVLMQAYVNKEAIEQTVLSNYATYFSRSRNELWLKGETSGNKQKIVDILVDCDEDSLIYLVEEAGPACHTNNETCFFRDISFKETEKPAVFSIFTDLYKKLETRKAEMPEGSYVTSLFKKGSDKIIQKVGEEAVETVIALKNKNKEEIIYESADLIFHLLLGLVDAGVNLTAVQEELIKRYK